MGTQRIDIMQEFIDLYKHEAMLAFFEFHLERAAAEPIRGLCRISKPKSSPHLPYLSLTFLVDVDTAAAHALVDGILARLDSATFNAALPVVTEVVPVPDMASGSANYIRQLDLMLVAHTSPGKPFIAERLLPTLRALTQFKTSEVVWWDLDEESAPPAAAPVAPEAAGSRIDGLTRRLKSLLGTETK